MTQFSILMTLVTMLRLCDGSSSYMAGYGLVGRGRFLSPTLAAVDSVTDRYVPSMIQCRISVVKTWKTRFARLLANAFETLGVHLGQADVNDMTGRKPDGRLRWWRMAYNGGV